MAAPRIYCPSTLQTGETLTLPAEAARHVQVLRLQPGDALTLFNGTDAQWAAVVTQMGRRDVTVMVGAAQRVSREAARAVHLWVGMPANERMDWLVEKATELGVARITPLVTARTVLRLSGERAQKRQAHWQAIAEAACEQCGRNQLPVIDPPQTLTEALAGLAAGPVRWVLDVSAEAQSWAQRQADLRAQTPVVVLSGPEGGLDPRELAQAKAAGFLALSLGARVLRAETAALLALGLLTAVP